VQLPVDEQGPVPLAGDEGAGCPGAAKAWRLHKGAGAVL